MSSHKKCVFLKLLQSFFVQFVIFVFIFCALEVSAKENLNIKKIFVDLVAVVRKKYGEKEELEHRYPVK